MPGSAATVPRTVLLLHSSAGLYGADRQLLLLARGLDPARYRPLVVVPAEGELTDALRAAGIEVEVRPLAVLRRELMTPLGLAGLARAWAADARALARLIARRRVALVHTNTSVTLGGAPAAARAGVPHVWHVREIYPPRTPLWPAHRRLLARAAALPCVSEATRAALDAERAVVVHDGLAVDAGPAIGEGKRESVRRELGLADDDIAVLLAGRISDWKGQDVLVRALAAPALAGLPVVALLAGDAWRGADGPRRDLVGLARDLGVKERVRLLGFRSDVPALYRAADVVTVPSKRPDPLPNSALEAAAAGCCVVASDAGGLPEIIGDGRTGVLVAPGDPAALASALASLARDGERRAALGRAAADDVRERFAPARMVDAVQGIYDGVVGRAG